MKLSLLYLIACAMIGYLARDHKFGFAGWFLISLFFTPLIGGLGLMFIMDDVKGLNQSDK
jgi:uncharacterized membrane protein YhdT